MDGGSDTETYECRVCGAEYTFTGEKVVCYGRGEKHVNEPVTVVRPCGICGDPITVAEMCRECADESDIDAMTPTWGTGR